MKIIIYKGNNNRCWIIATQGTIVNIGSNTLWAPNLIRVPIVLGGTKILYSNKGYSGCINCENKYFTKGIAVSDPLISYPYFPSGVKMSISTLSEDRTAALDYGDETLYKAILSYDGKAQSISVR